MCAEDAAEGPGACAWGGADDCARAALGCAADGAREALRPSCSRCACRRCIWFCTISICCRSTCRHATKKMNTWICLLSAGLFCTLRGIVNLCPRTTFLKVDLPL